MASDCLGVEVAAAPGEQCTLGLDGFQTYLQMLFRASVNIPDQEYGHRILPLARSRASGNEERAFFHSRDFKENIELIFNSFMVDEKSYWWPELNFSQCG